jgi:hypothetical protein
MSIIRVCHNRENPFVMIDKDILNNGMLTWKAIGLLTYLLSKPDNWNISIEHLSKVTPDGSSSVRSALTELEAEGYLTRRPIKENGKIIEWERIVYEVPIEVDPKIKAKKMTQSMLKRKANQSKDKQLVPLDENPQVEPTEQEKPLVEIPHVGKPLVGSPHVENRRLINNDLINKELINKELINNDSKDIKEGGPAEPDSPAIENAISKIENGEIKKPIINPFDEQPKEAVELTIGFFRKVAEYFPNDKQISEELTPTNKELLEEVKEMERLNRIGPPNGTMGFTWDEIRAMLNYIYTSPDHFWATTLKKVRFFRDKSSTIQAQMKRMGGIKNAGTTSIKRDNKQGDPVKARPAAEPEFDDEGLYIRLPGESVKETFLRIDSDPRYDNAKFEIFRRRVERELADEFMSRTGS